MIAVLFDALLGAASVVEPSVPLDSHDNDDTEIVLLISGTLFVFGVLCVREGASRYQKAQLVKNTVSENIRSMAIGQTELNGKTRPYEQVYQQPFFEGECISGKWEVHEWEEKNPDDRDDDSKGWVRKYSGNLGDGRIVLQDDTGSVILNRSVRTCTTSNTKKQGFLANFFEGGRILSRWFDFGPDEMVREFLEQEGIPAHSDKRRRYSQYVLTEGVDLYVLGGASRRDEDDDPPIEELSDRYENFQEDLVISGDEASGEYIISRRAEGQIVRRTLLSMLPFLVLGVLMMVAGFTGFVLVLEFHGFL